MPICYRKNGVSRRVLVIRGDSCTAFEEAIFVLRDETGLTEADFLQEAEKLAADYALPPAAPRRRLGLIFFFLLSAVLLFLLLFLLL